MSVLEPYFDDAYRTISGSPATLGFSYGSEWGGVVDPTVTAGEQASALGAALAERLRHDRERRVTTVGPHRDDPALVLEGHDVRVHGSQGEQRTTALALRLASHRAVTETTGVAPILLLDDVFSELDESRAERLASSLPEAQTFITSARPEDVPVRGRRWVVGEGRIAGETS